MLHFHSGFLNCEFRIPPVRVWRREWDSNPRYGSPYTRFPSVLLKPLGHLSLKEFKIQNSKFRM